MRSQSGHLLIIIWPMSMLSQERRTRVWTPVVALALAAALALALGARADPARDTQVQALVRRGAFLVSDRRGHLRVLDRLGRLVRSFARARVPGVLPQALELAPDRRHAFVSVYVVDRPTRLYDVDLATGAKERMADALSPVLSPDRTRLAYVASALRAGDDDIVDRTALVVRDLRTGSSRSIAFNPHVPREPPPGLVINWSPDGRTIALFDGSTIRLVDAATATTLSSQPALPGYRPALGRTPPLAPVFLNASTLVVLVGCCIGRQQLAAVDLRSGALTPFARLSSPPANIRRLDRRRLLAVTAQNELVIVSRGHTRVLARGIVAAAG
jgi:hypothetical protein